MKGGLPPAANSLLATLLFQRPAGWGATAFEVIHPRMEAISLERTEGELLPNVHSLLGPFNHHALLIFFKHAASLASNNLLSVYQEDQLLQWIIENVTLPNLQMLPSVNMPTTQAFARAMFRSALRKKDVDVIRTLLACGVDAHTVASSCERLTPLELVASSGHLELASTLLKWGAGTNSYSETALAGALCAAANRGNIDTVRLLLEKGAPVNMLGYSVLASAVAKPWLWCNKRGGDDTLLQLFRCC